MKSLIYLLILVLTCLPLGMVVGCGQTPELKTEEPVIKGKISSIDRGNNLVTINVGKDKDVKVGMDFTVYRGNTWLGVIRIDCVDENWSSSLVIGHGQSIESMRVGNEVITKGRWTGWGLIEKRSDKTKGK